MTVRWRAVSLDRPASGFERTAAFWSTVTDTTLSPGRDNRSEPATLRPSTGDACLRIAQVDAGPGGSRLELHVDDDVAAFASHAHHLGANVEGPTGDDVAVVRSPAGLASCIVAHRGESVRPRPQSISPGDDAMHILDQLCVDIPAARFEDECMFWSSLTGWELRASLLPEFRFLERPPWSPLRLLLQRRDDNVEPTRAHLDFACDDVERLVERHVALGAQLVATFPYWTVMADPAGLPFCITRRNPRTGCYSVD
jgi:Glyoxalase-like domain